MTQITQLIGQVHQGDAAARDALFAAAYSELKRLELRQNTPLLSETVTALAAEAAALNRAMGDPTAAAATTDRAG